MIKAWSSKMNLELKTMEEVMEVNARCFQRFFMGRKVLLPSDANTRGFQGFFCGPGVWTLKHKSIST